MRAYYETKEEIEVDGEYRLYRVDVQVEANDEFCELRKVIGISYQLGNGEDVPLAVDKLPAEALERIRSRLEDDDTRREIFEKACAIEADEDTDLDRKIRRDDAIGEAVSGWWS